MTNTLQLAHLALLVPCLSTPGNPLDTLWNAVVQVESHGDLNPKTNDRDSRGIVQIRVKTVIDCNRIAKLAGDVRRWTLDDRLSVEKSCEMFGVYLGFYGARYCKRYKVGRVPFEVLARIWNGGPDGWRKQTTDDYWAKVRKELERG